MKIGAGVLHRFDIVSVEIVDVQRVQCSVIDVLRQIEVMTGATALR